MKIACVSFAMALFAGLRPTAAQTTTMQVSLSGPIVAEDQYITIEGEGQAFDTDELTAFKFVSQSLLKFKMCGVQ